MSYRWPPGLPTKRTRVSLDCGKHGPQFAGAVIEDGPEQCMVQWDHGGTAQGVPVSHLVPEVKPKEPIEW